MLKVADELEINTQIFWETSRSFYGRSDKSITVGTSLTICNETALHVSPVRPLNQRLRSLEHNIIQGRSRKKLTVITNNILKLAK